jgi:hypothetical protein
MISLKRIVEQQGTGQLYDLGHDFANFRRTIDGSSDQIKQRFEQVIGSKLNGKRVRARASRGYKQYVKDYEFDVTKVTLDDYYDNYVVVAHDNTTPKAKEYFLKPGYKIQILGPANGQPSVGDGKGSQMSASPQPQAAPVSHDKALAQPIQRVGTPKAPVKESSTGHYDAYPVDAIAQDIKGWVPQILLKPNTAIRDFVKGLGWLKNLEHGESVALFDLVFSINELKVKLTREILNKLVQSTNKTGGVITTTYEVKEVIPDHKTGEFTVRIKKTMKDTRAV